MAEILRLSRASVRIRLPRGRGGDRIRVNPRKERSNEETRTLAVCCHRGPASRDRRDEETKKQAAKAAGLRRSPEDGPGANRLKQDAGTWDATVEMSQGPGQAPMVSKGVEVNTLIGGGLWMVSDFKSAMMGQPFEGHGVFGYDAGKKKYVSSWVDSWSSGLATGESTYDAATKKMTGWMEGPDMPARVTRSKMEASGRTPHPRPSPCTAWPRRQEFAGLKITYSAASSRRSSTFREPRP